MSDDTYFDFGAETKPAKPMTAETVLAQRLAAKRAPQRSTLPAPAVVTSPAPKGDPVGLFFAGMAGKGPLASELGPRAAGPSAALGSSYERLEDGGLLTPETIAAELIGSAYGEAMIAPLCDRRTSDVRGGPRKYPAIHETSRADGQRQGGVRAFWLEEGGIYTPTKPKFKSLNSTSRKLVALVYASAELAADVPALGGHMRAAFGAEMGFVLDQAVIRGDGAIQPLGVLNAPATITVAKRESQAASTLLGGNVDDLWSRMALPSRRRAVWLVHEDAEGALPKLDGITAGTSANYQPAGSNGIPYGTLYGRPIVPIEQASAVGSKGDIVLGDFSQYMIIDAGFSTVLSVDVAFLSDEIAWRFTWHLDGQPSWLSPVTPYAGSSTRSPFVTLAERA